MTLDFRMSTTCLYSDIVLPTATWYEKDDLNTSDMHPFIHPLTAATDPAWESRSDWDIYKGIAKAFSKACVGHLARKPTWSPCLCSMILPPSWLSRRSRTGSVVNVTRYPAGPCRH